MTAAQKSCVEYKCPHKIRNESIAESWQKCDFLEVVNDRIQLKHSHKYYAQITGQMAITGYHRTYFVVFTTKDSIFQDICTTIFVTYHTNFYLPDVS